MKRSLTRPFWGSTEPYSLICPPTGHRQRSLAARGFPSIAQGCGVTGICPLSLKPGSIMSHRPACPGLGSLPPSSTPCPVSLPVVHFPSHLVSLKCFLPLRSLMCYFAGSAPTKLDCPLTTPSTCLPQALCPCSSSQPPAAHLFMPSSNATSFRKFPSAGTTRCHFSHPTALIHLCQHLTCSHIMVICVFSCL